MTKYSLRDLMQIKNGKDYKNLQPGLIPVFGSGGYMLSVDKAIYNEESILLPRKGTLSNIQYVNKPFWTVDTLYYSIINKGKANAYYLFNYLKQLDLSRLNSGTGVPSMTFDLYYDLEINLPNLSTQQKISAVLSALDDKIELNNKINSELEAMAKTLYDYWFVQFDFPNAKGKPYKSSGGKMVYNEELKREVPEGWEVKILGKACNTSLGGTPSTKNVEYWNGNISWINSGEVANFPMVKADAKISKEAIRNSATKILKKGTVLISITRHLRPNILGIDACVNQSVVGIDESETFKKSFLYPFISNEIPRLMKLRTGAQQPHINKETVDNCKIINPITDILKKYYKISEALFDNIILNAQQNQELTTLRDWLLPMIMNGQISVGKGYEKMEEVMNVAAEDGVRYKKKR